MGVIHVAYTYIEEGQNKRYSKYNKMRGMIKIIRKVQFGHCLHLP